MTVRSTTSMALLALGSVLAMGQASPRAQSADVTFVPRQASEEMSHSSIVGLKVRNPAGEVVGDIRYLVLDGQGRVSTIVIGVGGILGLAEKDVGVPFGLVQITTNANNDRVATLNSSKDALKAAPVYTWTEKTTVEKMKETAKDLTARAKEKAKELTESATKKAEEMREKMSKPADQPK